MSELLIDWRTSKPWPEPEGWIEVGRLGGYGGGYEWTDFNAFYSPSARRFFWHGDSGCSCNSWSDDLRSASDFENDSQADLARAWEEFAKEQYTITTADYIDGVSVIKAYRKPQ